MKNAPMKFSLCLSLFCLQLPAQNPPLTAPLQVTYSGSNVFTIGTTGGVSTQGGLSLGNAMMNSGQIALFGAGGSSGSLAIQAPAAFAGNANLSWMVPSASIPTGNPSLLQISPSGAMYYALVTGNGINISQPAGSLAFSLGSSLNLGSSTPVLNDSSGNTILSLASVGAGGNYVKITNDLGGTTPTGPLVSSAGPGSGAIPLQLGDSAGGGVEIESNGGTALKVGSTTASPANFVSVNATPAGTFAGDSGVLVAAANATAVGDLSLVLKGQNNGSIYVGSNVDAAGSAFAIEAAADATTGVTKSFLVVVNSSANAIRPSSGTARPIVGVALNTTTSGNAIIAYSGKVQCAFDNTPVPGDYFVLSPSGNARCHDNGTTVSTTVQVLGTVLDSSGDVLLRIGN